MRNLAFSLQLLVSLFLSISCNASLETTISSEKNDFLFEYFGIDPVLKNIPKPVQYMISKELVDLVAGCFTVEKPYRTLVRNHKIETIAFNNSSGTILVFDNKDNLMLYDIEENMLHKRKPFNRSRDYPNGYGREFIQRVAFSPDDKKVAVLGQETIHEFENVGDSSKLFGFIEDELTGENFKTYNISNIEKLLQSRIASFGYTQDGKIMVATKNTDIALLDLPYEKISEHYINPEPITQKRLDYCNQFLPIYNNNDYCFSVNPLSKSALFFLGENLEITVFSEGTYQKILFPENPPLRPKLSALSPDGKFLAFIPWSPKNKEIKREEQPSSVYLWDTAHEEYTHIFTIDVWITSLTFSPESASLLIRGPFFWRLYDLNSFTCIAQKNIDYDSSMCANDGSFNYKHYGSFNTFKSSGNYFATAALTHIPNAGLHKSSMDVWKVNPLWSQLKALHTGQLTIEQLLLTLFLRDTLRNKITVNKALPTLAKKHNTTVKKIEKTLQRTFSTFSEAIKNYLFCLMGIPSINRSTHCDEILS